MWLFPFAYIRADDLFQKELIAPRSGMGQFFVGLVGHSIYQFVSLFFN